MKLFQVPTPRYFWLPLLITLQTARMDGASSLLTEDAESGSPAVTTQTASGYDSVQSEVVPQGSNAFFLTHTNSDQGDQILQLTSTFTADSSTMLYFESRLNWATSTQTAYVEVQESGGATWTTVWSEAGADSAGSSFFTLASVSLSGHAGKTLSLRFRYSASGSYYPSDSTGVGWVFDNIQVGDNFNTREWSIGEPTAKEQYINELLNRARADSQTDLQRLVETTDSDVLDAYDYFSMDFDILTAQFSGSQFGPGAQSTGETSAIPETLPPLAPNLKLLAAARLHTEDMFNNEFQGHDSSSGAISPNQENDKIGNRLQRQGYDYSIAAENVSAYSQSPWDSHAAFIVDWGDSASTGLSYGGMQDPPGHRNNVYKSDIREIGVGVVEGTNDSVGPLLVTHALATESSYDQPFITGVAYYDTDGDGFYGEGEGIGGVTISVDDSPYHALTPDSGGYAIPVTSNGNYSLSYAMPDGSTGTQSVTVSDLENVKADISPAWSSTTVAGTAIYETNVEVTYSVSPVAAATAYKLHLWEVASWPGSLDGESTESVTATTTGTYDSRQSAVAANGTYAYRLLSPDADNQTLEMDFDILPDSSTTLSWQDRLGIVHTTQEAQVQISTDSGSNWTTVETRNGPDSSDYATSFSSRSLSLGSYADQPLRIRFRIYNPQTSYFYSSTTENYGWYLDDITLTDAEILKDGISSEGPSYQWSFTTDVSATFLLRAQVINNTNEYPLGPIHKIQAVDAESATRETALVGTAVGSSWYSSSWMGYYYASDTSGAYWFYHYTLGWLYFGGISGNGAWYYDTTLGWLWTNSADYPSFYQSDNGNWLYYNKDSSSPRYFYDMSAGTWGEY